jgi:hypothetical protein
MNNLTPERLTEMFRRSAEEAEKYGEPFLDFPNPPISERKRKNQEALAALLPEAQQAQLRELLEELRATGHEESPQTLLGRLIATAYSQAKKAGVRTLLQEEANP